PILYALGIANVIIGRDNNLKNIDSSISLNFYDVLDYLFENGIDSFNNSILNKCFWASNIINPSAPDTRKLADLIFHKLRSSSIEDVAYYESIYSSYSLKSHSFYQNAKNIKVYREITEYILESNKSYFIPNKWFSHLLNFGLFGDVEDENKYFQIEIEYYNLLNKVIPYYKSLRLIQYGIYYGPYNRSSSSAYFSKYYEFLQSDSLINSQVNSLLRYASFEDITYNMNNLPNALIDFVESNKIIKANNSKTINFIYVFGYINQLELGKRYKKIDSLILSDSIVNSYKNEIESDRSYAFIKSYLAISDSISYQNYLSLRSNFRYLIQDSGHQIVKILIADVIEYATLFDDVNFADSLLH